MMILSLSFSILTTYVYPDQLGITSGSFQGSFDNFVPPVTISRRHFIRRIPSVNQIMNMDTAFHFLLLISPFFFLYFISVYGDNDVFVVLIKYFGVTM